MTTDYPSPEKQNNNDMDIIIGRKIKFRRKLLGMTQQSLAEKLGISFQQIQKYESGENKIYASRLYQISIILKTPLHQFFEEDARPGLSDQDQEGFAPEDLMDRGETATLIRVYYDIADRKKRKNAIEMMKGLHS